ncbi:MAG: hypothetical protein JWP65_2980 [Ramlibacter sp.]|jgi:toxin CptA|uniref:hypothetical protein n=1 Tax=Ramlibacter sp. TaxID=1917967 RepID=UPI0026283E0F|nr:hypothetical protein [Ramlibacter sp.]MDB5752559.1 hypothetical protein [Ramlibacter sp.]
MHAAPSASYPVGRSRFALVAIALAWLAALAGAVAWTLSADEPGWRQALAWGGVAACGMLAGAAWLRSPAGTLAWDGGGWLWTPAQGATEGGHPEVALDLQSRLLLRWAADGGAVRWLTAERLAAADHWDALRRAVYSRPGTHAPHGAPPPVA